ECPVIAPVSPKHKSTYSRPSTSVKCAPFARVTKIGNAPAHFFIQFIGTPPSSESCAALDIAPDLVWSIMKRCSSREESSLNFFRFIAVIFSCMGMMDLSRYSRDGALRSGIPSSQLVNNFLRRIRSARSRQAISGMRPAAAHKQSAHRRLVPRPIQNRPHLKQLIQRQLTVKNVSPSEP